jgi:hypothetical protein
MDCYETCIARVAKAIRSCTIDEDAFTASTILAVAFDKTKEEVIDDLVDYRE